MIIKYTKWKYYVFITYLKQKVMTTLQNNHELEEFDTIYTSFIHKS